MINMINMIKEAIDNLRGQQNLKFKGFVDKIKEDPLRAKAYYAEQIKVVEALYPKESRL